MASKPDDHPVDLLAALAVDAVDDVERRRLMRHVDRCAQCRAELDALTETAASLSVEEESVDEDLRSRVLAAVDDEPQRRRWSPAAFAAVVVAAAVAVVVSVSVVVWANHRDDAQPAIAQPTISQDGTMNEVLAAPDMRKATGAVGDGTVAAMYSPSMRATVVSVDGLPGVDPKMGYQVWITVDDQVKSAGVVRAGDKSSVVMTEMGTPVDVALSVEPMDGSPEPTSSMVVSFPVD
ncbi:anti-sigma factor [Gordonia sp. HY442]|uniref:anti-sigma factor n=1 Tax=Gordonia zhenghanii TaxID=2911516 RepID=UPI001F00E704|nr:anti-sigma factor [Gordonia zhenghanii]MCF8603848.1 anti-sigma factor [Gordonia zhenghanii]